MIELKSKYDCTGCTACQAVCPKRCIDMSRDEEGFEYPHIDRDACVDCGLCDRVCPVINPLVQATERCAYGGVNPNEQVRSESSSGGVFTLLAEQTLSRGGLVFGAVFDDQWYVVHRGVDSKGELAQMRGSKYLQSSLNDSFREVKRALKSGQEVLFSGSPCQTAGLRNYLASDYKNLILVDFTCHGVPSPTVFQLYLADVVGGQIKSFTFRDKTLGWRRFSTKAEYFDPERAPYSVVHSKDPFVRGFLRDIYLRPSCHKCPAKDGRSGSDITIADYWGVEGVNPELDDDKGCSLVIVNNEHARTLMGDDLMGLKPVNFDAAVACNTAYSYSVREPKQRAKFFAGLHRGEPFAQLVEACLKRPRWRKLLYKYKVRLKEFFTK